MSREAELRDRRDRRLRARTDSSDHKSPNGTFFVMRLCAHRRNTNSTGHEPTPAGTKSQKELDNLIISQWARRVFKIRGSWHKNIFCIPAYVEVVQWLTSLTTRLLS